MLTAIRHHIERAIGANRIDPDVRAEMESEDEALERRIERLEARSRALETATRELTAILQDMSKIARGEQ